MNKYRKNRSLNSLRPITIYPGLQKYAAASVLWCQGDTRVLTAVNIEAVSYTHLDVYKRQSIERKDDDS